MTCPTSSIAPVQAAYRDLPAKGGQPEARKFIESSMRKSINAQEWQKGRAYMVLDERGLTAAAGGSGKTEKAPADPKQAFTERYQALLLALNLVAGDAPEGVDVAEVNVTEEQVNAARAFLAHAESEAEDKGDAPEVDAVVKAGIKLASGKVAGARKTGGGSTRPEGAPQRNIANHIAEFLATVESGTFHTVADIGKFQSTEYGTDKPSPGAISARLFPSSGKATTIPGVKTGFGGADGKIKGITKL